MCTPHRRRSLLFTAFPVLNATSRGVLVTAHTLTPTPCCSHWLDHVITRSSVACIRRTDQPLSELASFVGRTLSTLEPATRPVVVTFVIPLCSFEQCVCLNLCVLYHRLPHLCLYAGFINMTI